MHILHLKETTSTMDVARQLVAQADTTTQAVLADSQTLGRGRLGRVWQTFPQPYSLACTYIIRQPCAHLPLLVALAALEALKGFDEGQGLTLKWPNDMLKNGRKIAGVLCERTGQHADAPTLVGVGLNIRQPPAGVPASFLGGFLEGHQNTENYAKKIGTCLFAALSLYESEGWAPFHNNYARACSTFGQTIVWRGPAGDTELTGLARGLNTSGHLELVAEDGTVHILHSGEIVNQAQMPVTASRPS
jgi:BirA family biotin operon repressor/biotin-[acetyl-CoA-carboxylase] ligase